MVTGTRQGPRTRGFWWQDLILAADVVYFEEQDPLVDALKELRDGRFGDRMWTFSGADTGSRRGWLLRFCDFFASGTIAIHSHCCSFC